MQQELRHALRSAAVRGDTEAFDSLLRAVAPCDVHEAVDALSVLACPDGRTELVETFLAAGFPPDARGQGGSTMLMAAALWGAREIMRRLVVAGADTDAADGEGRTPLMYAIQGQQLEAVQMLVEAGAHLDRKDACGRSVMDQANLWGEGIRLPFGMHISLTYRDDTNPVARWIAQWVAGGPAAKNGEIRDR